MRRIFSCEVSGAKQREPCVVLHIDVLFVNGGLGAAKEVHVFDSREA